MLDRPDSGENFFHPDRTRSRCRFAKPTVYSVGLDFWVTLSVHSVTRDRPKASTSATMSKPSDYGIGNFLRYVTQLNVVHVGIFHSFFLFASTAAISFGFESNVAKWYSNVFRKTVRGSTPPTILWAVFSRSGPWLLFELVRLDFVGRG